MPAHAQVVHVQALTKSQKKRLAKKKKEARETADAADMDKPEASNGAQTSDAAEEGMAAGENEQPANGDAADAAAKRKKKKKKAKKPKEQTDPPSIPLADLFPDGKFPEGEWQSYIGECAAVPTPPIAMSLL